MNQFAHHMRYCRVCIRVPSMRSGFPVCANAKDLHDKLVATQQPQMDNFMKREGSKILKKLRRKILKERKAAQ